MNLSSKPICRFFFLLYIFLLPISTVWGESHENVKIALPPPEVTAESAILIDAKTGWILYEKNKDKKEFPASTTKVMTALLAIENTTDATEKVYFSKDAVFGLPYGTSNIAMNDGETLTMDNALYGLMLASANEVANAIGEHVSGTTEAFAQLMTERAKELGAQNTNFMNPHGLHDENHYTTAYDLALIMKEAMTHESFIKYITTKSYWIPPTEKQPEERPLYNSNKLIQPGRYYYENIIGGKTGFTDEAQHTLVSSAKKDDVELICVVLKEEKTKDYTDSMALFDYGFSLYANEKILDSNNYKTKVTLGNNAEGKTMEIGASVNEDVYADLPSTIDGTQIRKEETGLTVVPTTIRKGDVVGTVTLKYGESVVATADLISTEDATTAPAPVIPSKETKKPAIANSAQPVTNENVPATFSFDKIAVVGALLLGMILVFLGTTQLVGRGLRRRKKRQQRALENIMVEHYKNNPERKYRYKS